MQAFSLLLYLGSSIIMASIFMSLLRTSECGALIIISELIFIVGICVYPILFMLGLVTPGREGSAYLWGYHEPTVATALHIFLFSLGAWMGNVLAMRLRLPESSVWRTVQFSAVSVKGDWQWFGLLMAAIIGYIIFINSVGFASALANAALARGRDFEGFGSGSRWLFLKTLANSFIYILVCAVPILLARNKIVLLSLYLVLVLFAYLNAVSRNMILTFIISPWIVYLMRNKHTLKFHHITSMMRPGFVLMMIALLFFGSWVLLYTKAFGNAMANYQAWSSSRVALGKEDTPSVFTMLLRNAEFAWFSTDAGIRHASDDSVLFLPKDVLLAPVGMIPSQALEAMGIPDIKNVHFESSLACVNGRYFPGMSECTIPPMWVGYSAYFLPFAGALLFGFLKFFCYARLSRLWREVKRIDYRHVWVIYFATLTVSRLCSVIPSAIYQAMFACLIVVTWFFLKRFIYRFRRPRYKHIHGV